MECTIWYFPKATLTFLNMEPAKKEWISSPFDERRNLLNAYFCLITENHLHGAQHGQMNPEQFSNSLKIPLGSTWITKSWKQMMRSPPVLITPREEARATYVFEFKLFIVKERSLSFAKSFSHYVHPLFHVIGSTLLFA